MGDVWDWIDDNIVDPITGAIGWLWDEASEFVGELAADVVGWFADALGYVFPGLDEVVYELAEIAYDIWAEVGEYLEPVIEAVLMYYGVPYQMADAMVDSFETMLDELHLEYMEEASKLETDISEEWNLVYIQIEREIEQESLKRFGAFYLLPLILRITRNKTLEVSSLLGRPYIISELEWIGQLHRILVWFRELPPMGQIPFERLFKFIDETIYKPYIDTKATLARSWFALFEGLLTATDGLSEEVDHFKGLVDEILGRIPGQIKDHVDPEIDSIWDDILRWRMFVYLPKIHKIEDLLSILDGRGNTNANEIKKILNRIINPADYLGEIDDTDPDKRSDVEDKVTDLSHRRYKRDTHRLGHEAASTYDDIDEQAAKGKVPVEKRPWSYPAVANPTMPQKKPVEKRLTWFVGDY